MMRRKRLRDAKRSLELKRPFRKERTSSRRNLSKTKRTSTAETIRNSKKWKRPKKFCKTNSTRSKKKRSCSNKGKISNYNKS